MIAMMKGSMVKCVQTACASTWCTLPSEQRTKIFAASQSSGLSLGVKTGAAASRSSWIATGRSTSSLPR